VLNSNRSLILLSLVRFLEPNEMGGFQSFILYFDNEDFLIMTGKILRISVSIYVDLMNCEKKLNDKLDRNKLKAHVSRYHSHGKVVLLNHCLS
jgi:hypothetical protein